MDKLLTTASRKNFLFILVWFGVLIIAVSWFLVEQNMKYNEILEQVNTEARLPQSYTVVTTPANVTLLIPNATEEVKAGKISGLGGLGPVIIK